MSGSGTSRREPPASAGADLGATRPGRWRSYALAAGFLAPAAFFLVVWIVYPTL